MIHGIVDVRGGRDQVGGEHRGPSARLDEHDLVMHGVPAGAHHAHARHHFAVIRR